jgi:dihydrofolate reductase
MIRLIVAVDARRGLADDNGIPWQGRLPTDARYFRDQTEHGTVVMGFRTYQEFDKPLHGRDNFVLSRPGSPPLRQGFVAVTDLPGFFEDHAADVVWVIGGAGLYQQSMVWADELFITRIEEDFQCTKFFPPFEDAFELASDGGERRENELAFRFQVWRRRPAS